MAVTMVARRKQRWVESSFAVFRLMPPLFSPHHYVFPIKKAADKGTDCSFYRSELIIWEEFLLSFSLYCPPSISWLIHFLSLGLTQVYIARRGTVGITIAGGICGGQENSKINLTSSCNHENEALALLHMHHIVCLYV